MRNVLLLLAALLIAVGVPSGLDGAHIYVVNSVSRTLSKVDTSSGSVNNSFATLGLTPNAICLDADRIYVTCSGDNAVQVLNRSTGAHIRYIPVAPSANPWDVLKVDDHLYVTGLFTNKVYKISLFTNSVVGSLTVGNSPEGLASWNGKLYVANTGGYQNNYAGSSISVIDLQSFSVEASIGVWTNPQYLLAHDGWLHVSCTGNWTSIVGRVDVINLQTLEVEHNIPTGGNPGGLWIAPWGTAYVGDGNDAGTYSYDTQSFTLINGSGSPLMPGAYDAAGNPEMIALLRQNWGSSSILYIRHPDFSAWQQYTLGLLSTDLAVYQEPSANDEAVLPGPGSYLYPNPLRLGDALKVKGMDGQATRITIFDLRGRKVLEREISGKNEIIMPGGTDLVSGVYYYKLESGSGMRSGKLVVLP
jgi:hypothetical protein